MQYIHVVAGLLITRKAIENLNTSKTFSNVIIFALGAVVVVFIVIIVVIEVGGLEVIRV